MELPGNSIVSDIINETTGFMRVWSVTQTGEVGEKLLIQSYYDAALETKICDAASSLRVPSSTINRFLSLGEDYPDLCISLNKSATKIQLYRGRSAYTRKAFQVSKNQSILSFIGLKTFGNRFREDCYIRKQNKDRSEAIKQIIAACECLKFDPNPIIEQLSIEPWDDGEFIWEEIENERRASFVIGTPKFDGGSLYV